MAKGISTPTRIAADVVAAASLVAPTEHRTTTEQINHWVRIGLQIERSGSVASRRVLDVASGEGQFSTLTDEEREVAHALVDAAIAERAAEEQFGPAARLAGSTAVSIDDDGRLIEIAADGSRRTL